MALVAAALLPHPSALVSGADSHRPADAGKSEYKKTVAGFTAVAKLLSQKKIDTLIVVSPRVHSETTPYAARPSDPSGYYFLGLDKVQVSLPHLQPGGAPRVFNADIGFIELVKQRARPFGLQVHVSPSIAIDEQASVALSLLQLAEPWPKIVSVVLPYKSPKELFEFGRILGGVAAQEQHSFALLAVGNLSSRLSKESAAGFDAFGAEFDQAVVSAAKKNDFIPVTNFNPAMLEKSGEEASRPLAVVAAAVHGGPLKSKLVSYEAVAGVGHAVLTWS